MVSLSSVTDRFVTEFSLVESANGVIRGVISETDQASQPSYVFVAPRHVLRVRFPSALKAGHVVRSNSGITFLVGENGPSETQEGTLWSSYRLFETTGRYTLSRRTTTIDAITKMKTEGVQTSIGSFYAAIEPIDRVQSDREMRQDFDQSRFISAADIRVGDILDNRLVTRVDKQLGLAIGILT